MRRSSGALGSRVFAPAHGGGSQLSHPIAGWCARAFAGTPWTLRARRLAARSLPALAALNLDSVHRQNPHGASVATEIALGTSMLLIIFLESRRRTERLLAMQALTQSLAGAQQYGNVVEPALEHLQRAIHVRAVWFRLLESGQLVATHAVGVSADFLRDAGIAEVTDDLSKLLNQSEARVTRRDAAAPEIPELLQAEKISQVVTVPVIGSKAPVGLLLVGIHSDREWTKEELAFLETYARQLAVAVENFRLLEQVLRRSASG